MNLIEILRTLEGLSIPDRWERLEEMGVDPELQIHIVKTYTPEGRLVDLDGMILKIVYDLPSCVG